MSQIPRPAVEVRLASPSNPVLRCEGEFDAGNASELEAHLTELVERVPDSLLLDLTEVSFLDVRVLSSIVVARRRLEANGTKLKIAASGQPLRVFRQTGVAVSPMTSQRTGGVIRATGRERPAERRRVAMRRPG